jgi:rubrerythrin
MNPGTGQAILGAIRNEAESRAFYLAAALAVKNPLVRRRLLGLADDEAQHQETLSRLYWSQTGREPGLIAPGADPGQTGLPPSAPDVPALLRMAIADEERSAREYERLAHGTDDSRVRMFLEHLVDWELGHAEDLNRELVRTAADPDWPDMTEGGRG